MNKIANYIVSGKGIGALVLLAFAFIAALYFSIWSKVILSDSIPHMQQIADEVLPITVENGKVVIPENTIKEIDLLGSENDVPFPFVIDTTRDTIETQNLTPGLYLSRSYFYSVSGNKTETYKLKNNFSLPRKDYTPLFQSSIKWLVVFMAIAGTGGFFLLFFILTLFYAFCANLAALIDKKKLSFEVRMRLSTVIFITVYLFSTILGRAGLNLNMAAFFLIVVILQVIAVKYLPLPPLINQASDGK